MKKTQSCSPLVRAQVGIPPYDFQCIKVVDGILSVRDYCEGPVVNVLKHKDYHTSKGKPITKILMKEYYSTCPCCGRSELVKREFVFFYSKDSIDKKFWENIIPYCNLSI